MPSEAVAPISTRRGGFALFRGRHARHERRIVMAAKLEPEQFEHVRADLLLRLSKCGTVDHNQLGDVLRRHAFERVTHQEVRQRLRYHEANMDGFERMPEGVAAIGRPVREGIWRQPGKIRSGSVTHGWRSSARAARRRAMSIYAPWPTCRRHASTTSPGGWSARSARRLASARLQRCSSLPRARASRRRRRKTKRKTEIRLPL